MHVLHPCHRAVLLLLLFALPLLAVAEERITRFHGDITINADATLTVTETIDVVAEGVQIKRGIYRDFPTRYTDRYGNTVRITFAVQSVRRNGDPEPYHLAPQSNGQRVYIGQRDTFIARGAHTYTLTYTVNRELGFFPDHDELYWNVTGHGWDFPIEQAAATVRLPQPVEPSRVRTAAFTGRQGATEAAYRVDTTTPGQVRFVARRPFGPREGLTIVVGFPKGLVAAPTAAQRARDILADNRVTLIGVIGLLVLLGYFTLAWSLVGRDRPAGTIVPLYTPPYGLSPAAMRYIRNQEYDDKVFAAALIDLGAKGYLTITDSDNTYVLTARDQEITAQHLILARLRGGDPMEIKALALAANAAPPAVTELLNRLVAEGAPIEMRQGMARMSPMASGPFLDRVPSEEEAELYATLLGTSSSFTLENDNYQDMQRATNDLKRSLSARYENAYFVTNLGAFLFGALIAAGTLVAMGAAAVRAASPDEAARLFVFGGLAMVLGAIAAGLWRKGFIDGARRTGYLAGAITVTLILLVGALLGRWVYNVLPALPVLCAAAITGITVIYYYLLRACTAEGRTVLDRIEGFRLYLSVAERDELKTATPSPEVTPEIYERYLPYALALDVEQAWSERFAAALAGRMGQQPYQPGWYHGRHWTHAGASTFAASLGSSVSSAIASSSTAPGSSSGFSGGSSGGGGGGGGGGGW